MAVFPPNLAQSAYLPSLKPSQVPNIHKNMDLREALIAAKVLGCEIRRITNGDWLVKHPLVQTKGSRASVPVSPSRNDTSQALVTFLRDVISNMPRPVYIANEIQPPSPESNGQSAAVAVADPVKLETVQEQEQEQEQGQEQGQDEDLDAARQEPTTPVLPDPIPEAKSLLAWLEQLLMATHYAHATANGDSPLVAVESDHEQCPLASCKALSGRLHRARLLVAQTTSLEEMCRKAMDDSETWRQMSESMERDLNDARVRLASYEHAAKPVPQQAPREPFLVHVPDDLEQRKEAFAEALFRFRKRLEEVSGKSVTEKGTIGLAEDAILHVADSQGYPAAMFNCLESFNLSRYREDLRRYIPDGGVRASFGPRRWAILEDLCSKAQNRIAKQRPSGSGS